MVCKIADNRPLKKLETLLNVAPRCHGKRRECVQGFETAPGNFVMGLPGTALGYCQALFEYAGDPQLHTKKTVNLLTEVEAPWSHSHELFWGHRGAESAAEFISSGTKPLIGSGRVPILITTLDPHRDCSELTSIMETKPPVPKDETVLVRMMLNSESSIRESARLLQELLHSARMNEQMPKWWPLLQGDLKPQQWESLRSVLRGDWDYVNVAINAFTPEPVFEILRDQITVAQIALPTEDHINENGEICIPAEMKITGAHGKANYSLLEFAARLQALPLAPTLIILGPALPGSGDLANQRRIAKVLPPLKRACDIVWESLTPDRRSEVWKLAA